MILVKPRKRISGNKVFNSLKAPQKHCTDLKNKTSTSSKRTTALRQPSGFQLASNVIYSTKKSATKHCTKRIQRLLTCNLRIISRWFSSRSCLVQNSLRTQTYFRLPRFSPPERISTAGNTSAFAGYCRFKMATFKC